jgi:hypothetical protein
MRALHNSPGLRFATRQIIVAAVAYLAAALNQGAIADWSAFAWGMTAAVVSALVGVFGPHEPFVGVTYPAEVPVPPAEPEKP